LVLELIEGQTLAERIAEAPVPVEQVVAMVRQIAEALSAAHDAGIIHRDLKPANIKVRPDGTVKVLDFGLAKAAERHAGEAADAPTMTAMSSQAGAVVGTAAYMAPEQARGEAVDKRADIWALGCVCYELLSGQRPFEGRTMSDTLASVLAREVDLTRLPDEVPSALHKFMTRCLEKDPMRRLRDAEEGVLQLEEGLAQPVVEPAETAVVTETPLRLWQRPVSVLGAVLTAAVIAGLTVWASTQPLPDPIVRFSVPIDTNEGLMLRSSNRRSLVVSPDGSGIVFAASGSLWLRRLDQLDPTNILGTEGASVPFFSPDSQSVGFWSEGQLKKVAVTGGAPVVLGEVRDLPDGATWGADGMVLYAHAGGIFQIPSASGTPELLLSIEEPEAAHGPQMLPDGEWVLFTLRSEGPGSWNEAQIALQSLATNERIVLFTGRDARYVQPGYIVYVLDSVLFAVPFDTDALAVSGGPVPFVEDVAQALGGGGGAQYSLSDDGTLVFIPGGVDSGENFSLAWLTSAGDILAMPTPERPYENLRVSPDGSRAAVSILDDGNQDIWVWRIDQGPLTRLTFAETNDTFPLWTPDSKRVVFTSARDGGGGLFAKAADGTGEVERLLQHDGTTRAFGWSPDGALLFDRLVPSLANTIGRDFLQRWNVGVLSGGDDRVVTMLLETDFRERYPALSPDGRWMAYTSDESGRDEIYVRPFPGVDQGKWQVSTGGGQMPLWAPDGRGLYFQESLTRVMFSPVEVEPTFSPGNPTVFRLDGADLAWRGTNGRRHYDIDPAGDRFLVRRGLDSGDENRDIYFRGLIVVENWFEELKERIPLP